MQVTMTNAIYQLSQPRSQFIEGITNCLEIPRSDDRQALDDKKNEMDEDDYTQTLSPNKYARRDFSDFSYFILFYVEMLSRCFFSFSFFFFLMLRLLCGFVFMSLSHT
jgi:hypothetical protein